jgi:hypothetical protein
MIGGTTFHEIHFMQCRAMTLIYQNIFDHASRSRDLR